MEHALFSLLVMALENSLDVATNRHRHSDAYTTEVLMSHTNKT